MEISVLDSRFRRTEPFENWSSLIWSERGPTIGDFQMTTYDIDETLTTFPVGDISDPPCVVALADSPVPMVVEDHKIERDDKGKLQIITTGRSFESVLDRRQSIQLTDSQTPRPTWVVEADAPSDAAWYVVNQIVKVGIASSLDIIPEIEIVDRVSAAWAKGREKYPIEPKDLLTWLYETVALGGHNIRASLPSSTASDPKIEIAIYDGTDRTKTITFDAFNDDFSSEEYYISKRGYQNAMITQTKNGVTSANTGVAYSGLARRVGYQDLSSDITLAAGPELDTLAKNKGIISLADALPTNVFQGEVTEVVDLTYNVDFFVGDKVTLAGRKGMPEQVVLSEFIRTQDATGYKAYPAFEKVMS